MRERRPIDSTTKSSLTIALILHAIAFVIFFVWAAKTGRLDPILTALRVVPVAKEKANEPPKETKADSAAPKPTPEPKAAAANNTAPVRSTAPPPSGAPAVAPPPAGAADFVFDDGAKAVISSTNAPILAYKNLIEETFRRNWKRPPAANDQAYLVETEIQLDPAGKITGHQRLKGSGDSKWDESVDQAITVTKSLSLPPPKGFPHKFLVRFDVTLAADPLTP